jgi:Protein of unknown function (DUF2800)
MNAVIRPSSLALTVACAASVRLQATVPPLPPTEEDAEGTAAHWVAMQYAAGRAAEFPVGAKFRINGRDWEVDMDMSVGARIYAAALEAPNGYLRLEDTVKISRIHPDLCHGTPDAWRFFPTYTFPEAVRAAYPRLPSHPVKLIRIGEYKYGHRWVEVFDNAQMSAYAAGVMERLNLTDNDPDLWVELVLVQPRTYTREGPVRTWRIEAVDLRPVINQAWNAVQRALLPEPPATTNEHCIDCTARSVCKTLQYATSAFIDFSTSAEVVEMPAEAIGQEMIILEEAMNRLKARLTGLQAQAEALLQQGKPVAFYHMEPGQSRMIYRDDVDIAEVIGLGDLLGVDLRKPQTKKDQLVTPRQAIDLGVDADIIKKYSHRPPAAYKLARDDTVTARKVFYK